jgi:hypothetical protein
MAQLNESVVCGVLHAVKIVLHKSLLLRRTVPPAGNASACLLGNEWTRQIPPVLVALLQHEAVAVNDVPDIA